MSFDKNLFTKTKDSVVKDIYLFIYLCIGFVFNAVFKDIYLIRRRPALWCLESGQCRQESTTIRRFLKSFRAINRTSQSDLYCVYDCTICLKLLYTRTYPPTIMLAAEV